MKKVFIALSLIILVFGLSIWFLYPKKDIKTTSQEEVKEIVQDKNEEDLKDENIKDNTINNNDDIRSDISSIQNSDKNNMESNDTSKSNVIKNETKGKKTRVFTCVSGKFFVPLQPENSNKSAKW